MSFSTRRTIEFIYSATVAYVLVFEDLFVRVYFDGVLVTTVDSPYREEHLFELQYRQIGDVMRIVHPQYKPRKLSRTSATTFTLTEIDFKDGPFMVRNDLIDSLNPIPTTLECSATIPGLYGTLVASVGIFLDNHVGALFQLTHPKTTTTVSASGTTDSATLYVKGSFRFITRGTWTGTIYVKRRENSGSWETFRTYVGSTGAEQNVSWTLKEDSDNVEYYIEASSASAGFRAELSSEDLYASGVVRVTSFGSKTRVIVQVVSRIESTSATRKWAEGSWSDYRGWPASITFFENRCIYAGSLSNSDLLIEESGYPELRRLA